MLQLGGIKVAAADTHQTLDHGQAKSPVTAAGLITHAMKRLNCLGPL
jgi:hypothetical protein